MTLWHQDNRYWSFEKKPISVWLALGDENKNNGCIYVIPESHRLKIHPERFNEDLFLKDNDVQNELFIKNAEAIELQKGDVLFFFIVSYFMPQKK